ncbi:hypothetical protein Btru_048902 [Bulinus truncatus]|nr:hypothetical protein Btru_048902 [Bulinus truncatus]
MELLDWRMKLFNTLGSSLILLMVTVTLRVVCIKTYYCGKDPELHKICIRCMYKELDVIAASEILAEC